MTTNIHNLYIILSNTIKLYINTTNTSSRILHTLITKMNISVRGEGASPIRRGNDCEHLQRVDFLLRKRYSSHPLSDESDGNYRVSVGQVLNVV